MLHDITVIFKAIILNEQTFGDASILQTPKTGFN